MVKLEKNSGGWFKILSLSRVVTEDRRRYREILLYAPSIIKPFSGCLKKLKRFGMNRFSQNTEFLVHQTVVLKLLLINVERLQMELSDDDPSLSVFLHVAC